MNQVVPQFITVIHPVSVAVVLNNVQIAVDAKADGIFLINQGMDSHEVWPLAAHVKEKHPDLWIGINILGQTATGTLRQLQKYPLLNGLWVDNALVDERLDEKDQLWPSRFLELRGELGWKGLYFGGFDFKGQRRLPLEDLPRGASLAAKFIDVVTTSGAGTGFAANIDRIKAVREGLGPHPLALASGVTPDNVDTYLPYVDSFLVASGIEDRFGYLNPEKTAKLSELIHAYKK